jgi:hypothetical protein
MMFSSILLFQSLIGVIHLDLIDEFQSLKGF